MIELDSLTEEEAALIAIVRLARRKRQAFEIAKVQHRFKLKDEARRLRGRAVNTVDVMIAKKEEIDDE